VASANIGISKKRSRESCNSINCIQGRVQKAAAAAVVEKGPGESSSSNFFAESCTLSSCKVQVVACLERSEVSSATSNELDN
jgi:hypothetical protein